MTGKKILIIDDDPNIVTTLGKFFKDAGATVSSSLSYDEGLAAIVKNSPDVAIVDLLLPQHSGLDLIKEARKLANPSPFFVILTNSVNAEHIADALGADVTMYVQKADHDPQEIVDMIAKHFEGK